MKGHLEQDLVHDIVEPNELFHRRLAHVHYKALPLAIKVVEGLPEIQANMTVSAKNVRKERTQRRNFQVARARKKESWKSSTSMYAVQCHLVH